jgi:hypothetical protein
MLYASVPHVSVCNRSEMSCVPHLSFRVQYLKKYVRCQERDDDIVATKMRNTNKVPDKVRLLKLYLPRKNTKRGLQRVVVYIG